jgi:hypothetical protein
MYRTCPNAFDCNRCPDYDRFASMRAAAGTNAFGLDYPAGRGYDRGHTWVRQEDDGVITIGLDDLGERVIGTPEAVELPAPGTKFSSTDPRGG